MSTLKPRPDEALFDENAVAGAVALLAAAAQKDLLLVQARLRAVGLEIVTYSRLQASQDLDASLASDIGSVVDGRGIYHGLWQPERNGVIVHAYSDPDLLKEATGEQMLLTWYDARDELARRNNGRLCGDGTERALRQAVAKPSGTQGAYQDGDLVMGPQELLNGFAPNGENVRKGRNTFDLLSGAHGTELKNISKTLKEARSDDGRWSWSCSEGRDNSSFVRAVRLSDGVDGWYTRDFIRLGVLPFRIFREIHVAKAISHLNI
jgi:hypothetical protein